MEASYEDYMSDLAHFRLLGASEEAIDRVEGLVQLFFFMYSEHRDLELALERRMAHVNRLREQVFGQGSGDIIDIEPEPSENPNNTQAETQDPSTESTCQTSSSIGGEQQGHNTSDLSNDKTSNSARSRKPGRKGGGGKLGCDAYHGAEVTHCCHQELIPGSKCPLCKTGTLYQYKKVKTKVVFTGKPPLEAVKYVIELLRCNLCLAYFDAPTPINVARKYQYSAIAFLAVLHTYLGMPYYRLARMQSMMGMPLPASTQSGLISQLHTVIESLFGRLIVVAANNPLIHQDDTGVKIVELIRENKLSDPERKGMYSSVFVSKGEQTVILVFSGRSHAGENFGEIIEHREEGKGKILRMADALASNRIHTENVIDLNCNAHAFRRFKLIKDQYPEQCTAIMHLYGKIFDNIEYIKQKKLSQDEAFEYQTKHSLPIMNELYGLVDKFMHECEPNSSLGQELKYMNKNRERLVRTLLIAGAPFENNDGERAIKIPIIYRKNSHIFKTTVSAGHISRLISVIATAEQAGTNPFDYIEQIQRFESLVLRDPDAWLPWNYQSTIKKLGYATARQSSAMAA